MMLQVSLTIVSSRSGKEFMFIILPEPGFDDFRVRPSNEEYMKRLHEFVGDSSIPINLKVRRSRCFFQGNILTKHRMSLSGISTKQSLRGIRTGTYSVSEMLCIVIHRSMVLVGVHRWISCERIDVPSTQTDTPELCVKLWFCK